MRKIYLDNIRLGTVILVLIYHVCYIFNGSGVPGAISCTDNIPVFDAFACLVYPWFMVLLFAVSGMCARYSLQKRICKQFIKERALKLLVPSTLGLFIIHWVTGYFNIKMGGGIEYIPRPLIYPVSAVSGIGPLWFIQTLFLFSCAIVILKKLDKSDRLWNLFENIHIVFVILLFIPLWGGSKILNMPILTMYRFGIYFTAFLIGYYILSHEKIQRSIEKIHLPMLFSAILSGGAYIFIYKGQNYTAGECLESFITNLYLWLTVLALMGCGRKYLDRETAVTRYLAKNSFGIYILHYPVLITVCFILQYHTSVFGIWKYLTAFVAEFAITFILNEIIKRIPFIRFAVIGLKRE